MGVARPGGQSAVVSFTLYFCPPLPPRPRPKDHVLVSGANELSFLSPGAGGGRRLGHPTPTGSSLGPRSRRVRPPMEKQRRSCPAKHPTLDEEVHPPEQVEEPQLPVRRLTRVAPTVDVRPDLCEGRLGRPVSPDSRSGGEPRGLGVRNEPREESWVVNTPGVPVEGDGDSGRDLYQ